MEKHCALADSGSELGALNLVSAIKIGPGQVNFVLGVVKGAQLQL